MVTKDKVGISKAEKYVAKINAYDLALGLVSLVSINCRYMIVNSPLPLGPPATVPQRRSASSSPPADQPAEGRVPWDHHCDWAWFGYVSFNSIWLSSDKYEMFVATFDFFTRLDGKFQERQHKMRADRGSAPLGLPI